jgi:hypothetical protein
LDLAPTSLDRTRKILQKTSGGSPGRLSATANSAGQQLAYVYFEEEPGRRAAAKLRQHAVSA